ncbi:hypothetical protein [Sulfoacidibacillus ferrooxidans]|uniref:Uncharacterized protein n=1 Tax=Sulfoacidibacillus ferrooxidans TaxID=2005001 RepID=A0A9X2AEF8_9BACL|nr:hypothetical protein [Sulfoacidibacillus ferrooxidans]MCI0184540.1 hypothetical protein [Sulfoacidibacillus ferrooxidans]
MAKREKPSHVQVLRKERGTSGKPTTDDQVLSDAMIDLLYDRIVKDTQTNRRLSTRVHSFSPDVEHQGEDVWVLVAEGNTPIKTSQGDLTLHDFLKGFRAGAEIHVHRDEILFGLLTLVAEQESFRVAPVGKAWWAVSRAGSLNESGEEKS